MRRKPPSRPTLSFKEVTCSGRATLTFSEDEIVVFVGPNSAGKSATLREMKALVSRNGAHTVVKNASFQQTGKKGDLESYLERFAQKSKPSFVMPSAHILWWLNVAFGMEIQGAILHKGVVSRLAKSSGVASDMLGWR